MTCAMSIPKLLSGWYLREEKVKVMKWNERKIFLNHNGSKALVDFRYMIIFLKTRWIFSHVFSSINLLGKSYFQTVCILGFKSREFVSSHGLLGHVWQSELPSVNLKMMMMMMMMMVVVLMNFGPAFKKKWQMRQYLWLWWWWSQHFVCRYEPIATAKGSLCYYKVLLKVVDYFEDD